MTSEADMPILHVTAERTAHGMWLLSTPKCSFCGRPHQHGGGTDEEPSYGSRVTHCLPQHKPFREDCLPERTPGGRSECRVMHGGCMVELESLPNVTHL